MTKKNLDELIHGLPLEYLKTCWPEGCPKNQRTEITLAFYAGMIGMFCTLNSIAEAIDNENDAGDAVEIFVEAVKAEAMRLNNSTASRFKSRGGSQN